MINERDWLHQATAVIIERREARQLTSNAPVGREQKGFSNEGSGT